MPDHTHRWIVDSIEESAASVEVDGDEMITLPRSLLPGAVREGDVLNVRIERPAKGDRAALTIEIDRAATQQALADSAAQVEKGRKRSNDRGGDITL